MIKTICDIILLIFGVEVTVFVALLLWDFWRDLKK